MNGAILSVVFCIWLISYPRSIHVVAYINCFLLYAEQYSITWVLQFDKHFFFPVVATINKATMNV